MKTLIILLFSAFLLPTNSYVETKTTDSENEVESQCYWEETFSNNISVSRGTACGSDTSLKIYYTNPYSYKVRVGFYLADENGYYKASGAHVISVAPGKRIYHHKCKSNGGYIILAAKYGTGCSFPIL